MRKRRARVRLHLSVAVVLVSLLMVRTGSAATLKEAFRSIGMIQFTRVIAGAPFLLAAVDGRAVSLESLRGKVVFLNFWATWCVPCRREMPAMQSLANAFAGEALAMVAVSQDVSGAKAVRPFVEELKLDFTILLDADKKVTNLYQVRALPSTYLLDRDGNILGVALGPREWNSPAAHALIKMLLEKPATTK